MASPDPMAAADASAEIHWPALPFFNGYALDASRAKACTLQLLDGRALDAQLVRFEVGADSVDFLLAGRAHLVRIRLDRVRFIRLTDPLGLAPDPDGPHVPGRSTPDCAQPSPFALTFHDGQTLSGSTLGYVKNETGLFLYVVEYDGSLVFGVCVPAHGLKDVSLGPTLEETLIASGILDRETAAAALAQHAETREMPIPTFLTDRAVITAEALSAALAEQKRRPHVRLGDVLVEAKVITAGQLESALAIQAQQRGRRLGDILIEMQAVTLRLIQMALAEKLGIPYVNARDYKTDFPTLELVDPAFAVRHNVLPLLRTGDSLVIAVENPLAIEFAQDLRFATDLIIVPVMADPEELKERIGREYLRKGLRGIDRLQSGPASNRVDSGSDLGNIEDLASQLSRESGLGRAAVKLRDVDPRVTDNTLVRLINKIIVEAHAQGASDIHIESNPGHSHTRIRFRKDGELEDYLDLPPAYRNSLISRLKVMADLNIAEHRQPQDGKIDFGQFGPLNIELRVAVIPTANNLEDVVLRILGGMEPLPLDRLGFSERDLTELNRMIVRSYGLILVCGPTGSGKTTTLHSMLAKINQPDLKIWTAEDPIEITQPGLRQVQVQPKIDWTFATAMRAFLRADPDVIMVGEMRDAETTKIGIEASLTGHLVFSTLHTNSAAESVLRLLDLGMDPFNFADALIGILSQRLARTLCAHCKRAHVASAKEIDDLLAEYCSGTSLDRDAELRRWRDRFARDGQLRLYDAVGCAQCRKGYKGRMGVYELLATTPAVKDRVRVKAALPQLIQASLEGGMRLLKHDAIDKLWQGHLDLASARTAAN